jgi:hypothetical protein
MQNSAKLATLLFGAKEKKIASKKGGDFPL